VTTDPFAELEVALEVPEVRLGGDGGLVALVVGDVVPPVVVVPLVDVDGVPLVVVDVVPLVVVDGVPPVAVDVGGLAGGVLEVLGAATLTLALFDAHAAFVQEAGFVTTTARAPWLATSVTGTAILT